MPAREKKWFIALFDLYVRSLFYRRFNSVSIHQNYYPGPGSKTIYYLNHNSWWDGLIPFLLNQKIFRQNARAMMEDTQMRKFSFFQKIGAFSIDPGNRNSAARSLRYAVKSMKRPGASLFIYPEGEIVPFSPADPKFKKGLGWISGQCMDSDVVPVGIYINSALSDKPDLFITVGKPVKIDHSLSAADLNGIFETEMGKLLRTLQKDACKHPEQFRKL